MEFFYIQARLMSNFGSEQLVKRPRFNLMFFPVKLDFYVMISQLLPND